MSASGLLRAAPVAGRHVSYALIVSFMVLSAVLVVLLASVNETVGFDFRGTLWEPAQAIWHGRSPYPAAVQSEVEIGNPALYPPVLMLAVVPLSLLPWWLALTVWMLISAGSVFVALRLLGVRDWRCYAIALLSAPAVSGLTWGNATLLLVPLVALGWRWRSHTYRGGAVLGVAIAAKLFLWPVVFWLLGTRRYRPVMATVVACAAFALLPWGMIGFRGFSSYPDLLRVAEGVYATHSFSIATMLRAVGVDADFAPRGGVAVGLALALFAFALARRGAEEAAFAVVILAAIVGSPIVWPYYYVLLVVPLAIVRPRFSLMWAALGLFYIADRLPRPWLDSSEAQLGGIACCLPDGVPLQVWLTSHSPAGLWPALAYAAFGCFIVLSCAFASAYRGLAPPVSRDDASEVPRSPTLTCSER